MNTSFGSPASWHRTHVLYPILLVWVCFLGGCAAFQSQPSEAGAAAANVRQLPLDYYAWVKTAPERDLRLELAGLDANKLQFDPIIRSVRTSMILTASALASNQSEKDAFALLTRVASLEAKDEGARAYKVFAEVLQSVLQQRRDLQAVGSTHQKALSEIADLRKKNTELQQQIDGLTSIEQQIIERERLNTQER